MLVRLHESAIGGVGPGATIVAYSILCTHKGCPVAFRPERKLFICPCHWSSLRSRQGGRDGDRARQPGPAADRAAREGRSGTGRRHQRPDLRPRINILYCAWPASRFRRRSAQRFNDGVPVLHRRVRLSGLQVAARAQRRSAPGDNALGLDLRKQQPAMGTWISPNMHSVVTDKDGSRHHIAIIPDNDLPRERGPLIGSRSRACADALRSRPRDARAPGRPADRPGRGTGEGHVGAGGGPRIARGEGGDRPLGTRRRRHEVLRPRRWRRWIREQLGGRPVLLLGHRDPLGFDPQSARVQQRGARRRRCGRRAPSRIPTWTRSSRTRSSSWARIPTRPRPTTSSPTWCRTSRAPRSRPSARPSRANRSRRAG